MLKLPDREELYDFCKSNLMNLYNDKYITNGFYKKTFTLL